MIKTFIWKEFPVSVWQSHQYFLQFLISSQWWLYGGLFPPMNEAEGAEYIVNMNVWARVSHYLVSIWPHLLKRYYGPVCSNPSFSIPHCTTFWRHIKYCPFLTPALLWSRWYSCSLELQVGVLGAVLWAADGILINELIPSQVHRWICVGVLSGSGGHAEHSSSSQSSSSPNTCFIPVLVLPWQQLRQPDGCYTVKC